MIVNADLHVHSCFSMASSKDMLIENMAPQAKLKGLNLMGTGDALHPKWLDMIEEATTYEGDGIYSCDDCNFILTSEIEGYKKVHHVLILPSLNVAREISERLDSKNKYIDGRPKTKLDGAEIMDLVHEYDGLCGPAHAFTPWTGMYKSVNSFKECYGGRPDFIELGLSADTDMADLVKELQDITFLSNSDAHSPWPHRLGREFNQIKMDDMSFTSIKKAIKNHDVVKNYGLVPNLGKYHMTACTKCYNLIDPLVAKDMHMKCSCGGTIKKGVDYRISEIADWSEPHHPSHRPEYVHLMPLSEIISIVYDKGITTKTVQRVWSKLVDNFGTELDVLLNVDIDDIKKVNDKISPAIQAFRNKTLHVNPGGGGKYGEILFDNSEIMEESVKTVTLDNFI
jgi:uncharacterized protein (TIGR00375 family)